MHSFLMADDMSFLLKASAAVGAPEELVVGHMRHAM